MSLARTERPRSSCACIATAPAGMALRAVRALVQAHAPCAAQCATGIPARGLPAAGRERRACVRSWGIAIEIAIGIGIERGRKANGPWTREDVPVAGKAIEEDESRNRRTEPDGMAAMPSRSGGRRYQVRESAEVYAAGRAEVDPDSDLDKTPPRYGAANQHQPSSAQVAAGR